MVLVIIGRVLLGLLALLVLLMLCPVIVEFRFEDGAAMLAVRLLGFIRLRLLPARPKSEAARQRAEARKARKKAKKKKDKPAEGQKSDTPPKKRSFSDILTLVQNAANAATRAMRVVLKGFWVYGIALFVPVSAADAAATALRAGQMQAAIGTTRALLENMLHLRWKKLVVYPDFIGRHEERFTFSCKVLVIPVIMLSAGILGFFTFLRYQVLGPRAARRRLPPAKRRELKRRLRAAKKARATAAKEQQNNRQQAS